MGLFARLRTLFSSNVNHWINKAEDPEKMLNQLILDMDTQLIESKKAVASAIADEKKLERDTQNQEDMAKEWENKAVLAIKAGKDDLAREALLRKQEYDTAAAEWKKQWNAQHIAVEHLKLSLRDLQNRLDEAARKKNLLIARSKRAEAQKKIQETMSSISSSRSSLNAFSRISDKVDQLEAEANAAMELEDFTANNDLEKKFRELEMSDSGVDKMLEDLKAKIATPQIELRTPVLLEANNE
jgi:phage shock protein A